MRLRRWPRRSPRRRPIRSKREILKFHVGGARESSLHPHLLWRVVAKSTGSWFRSGSTLLTIAERVSLQNNQKTFNWNYPIVHVYTLFVSLCCRELFCFPTLTNRWRKGQNLSAELHVGVTLATWCSLKDGNVNLCQPSKNNLQRVALPEDGCRTIFENNDKYRDF